MSILCVSDGMISVVLPALELARRLATDGHTVLFASSPQHRELAESLGLVFEALPRRRPEHSDSPSAELGPLRQMAKAGSRSHRSLSALGLDGFTQVLQNPEIELALIDGEMHEQIVVALGVARTRPRLRVALLNSFASIWRCPGLPPPHTDVIPGSGWRGSRLGIAALWWSLKWRKRRRRVRNWLRDRGRDRVTLLQVLAKEHGFDLEEETDTSQWLMPFTYRRPAVLSLHALEFEFPHQPPPQVHYVGPMMLRDRDPLERSSPTERERIERVLEECRRTGGTLVYAAFGSTLSVRPDFLKRLVAACDAQKWTLILGLGASPGGSLPKPQPETVHTFRWVPQLRVLEEATVVITHGGINTLDECVLHGVPMVVYCGRETDMAGNAARVAYHGIGRVADPRDSSEKIAQTVRSLLDDGSYRERIDRLRQAYLTYERLGHLQTAVRHLLPDSEKSTTPGRRER